MLNITLAQGLIEDNQADTIIVNFFAGSDAPAGAAAAIDKALDGALADLIAAGDIRGKAEEVTVLYPRTALSAQRVLVVGLGERDNCTLNDIRLGAAAGLKKARALRAKSVASIVHGAGETGLAADAAAQAVAEGTLLAAYRFDAQKQYEEPPHTITQFTLVEMDENKIAAMAAGLTVAQAVAAGVYLARDLVNMPPNVATPTRMAAAATETAETYGMDITIGDRAWAAARNMGGFLAVAKGAGEPPKFIVMEYKQGGDAAPIILVGKGITFDTGGISIKPTQGMWDMKADMGGAAAVLGTMETLGRLNLPLNVIGIAPCTENMPDANAYRPADVITISNGKTVEIKSTDAEGRMVLADGLSYAQQYNPAAVIDLATLTGSCVIALGENVAAGLFSKDDDLRSQLLAASAQTRERIWHMPLWDVYREAIKSPVADVKNSGGRYGGVATSAVFLQTFTDDKYPWAHLDIASMALRDDNKGYEPEGGTGFGVRLLTAYLQGRA